MHIERPSKVWSDLIQIRAAPWAKRLQILGRLKGLMETYRKAKQKYLEKDPSLQDPLTVYQFNSGDNLLNFLPKAVFYGQRPSVWWTHRHDIDLIIGTFKYGYANYAAMRADRSLSFN